MNISKGKKCNNNSNQSTFQIPYNEDIKSHGFLHNISNIYHSAINSTCEDSWIFAKFAKNIYCRDMYWTKKKKTDLYRFFWPKQNFER